VFLAGSETEGLPLNFQVARFNLKKKKAVF
jgi:hypothetical protein